MAGGNPLLAIYRTDDTEVSVKIPADPTLEKVTEVLEMNGVIGEDNCILSRWGGELFVNGLYFSICKTMEGSLQNAFHIAFGLNLTEVEETIDYSNTFSQIAATDNYGHKANAQIPLAYSGLPFEKTLHAAFSYSDDMSEEQRAAQFDSDFSKYMRMIQEVEAHYSVRYADLSPDDPFQELASYEVGDTGIIEDRELEISTTQRIMKTVTNLLTGERISTETGNVKRSIARRQPYSNTVTTSDDAAHKQIDALALEVENLETARLRTWGTAFASGMTWAEAERYKWKDAGV